jgi:hypothetical protein
VAQRLLDLEARLPAENSVCCSSFGLWQTWRRNVERAEAVTELMPQVLPPRASVCRSAFPGCGGVWPFCTAFLSNAM